MTSTLRSVSALSAEILLHLAPDLIRRRPGPTGACYFHKQPPSEGELNNKQSRQWKDVVRAVGYQGTNPTVLAGLSRHSMDTPKPLGWLTRLFRKKQATLTNPGAELATLLPADPLADLHPFSSRAACFQSQSLLHRRTSAPRAVSPKQRPAHREGDRLASFLRSASNDSATNRTHDHPAALPQRRPRPSQSR